MKREGVKLMTKAKVNGVECRVYGYKWVGDKYYCVVCYPELFDKVLADVPASLVELSIN